ncbi:CCA tRNA nucleotidyltransferase [Petroclostridium sp. X23]|uniref:CCA tRNA nucleotidyltransferase n=1 Tax=Petroclostridium sp. X23 TaxID=3045146 RepID=UPI0024AD65B9|nr:CCA tRNA nucleotidyltransferase [Petroclostridium sp. X23]WHH60306.1 CCA tRNA nucleotidyltransferase [Petroclostridium sp. X23]
MVDINIPAEAAYILEKLNENSYAAYIVGGCVRDAIRNENPKDWDITTSATPQQVKEIFDKTYDTGIRHGTVTVMVGNSAYEVTTFRIEKSYQDYRRPSQVIFTSDLLEDLKRRDFTMNAIAYHPKEGLIDPFNGRGDILAKLIRCVGNANERFQEDALRMLRAVRFSCQLDFQIDTTSFDAIIENNELIVKVSMERIREEINKMLLSDFPSNIFVMKEAGLMEYILPELDICFATSQNHPYHIYNVGSHILKAIESIEKDPILKWVMLLHDIGKAITKTTDSKGIDHFYGHGERSVILAQKALKRLKFDKKSIDKILRLIKWHDRPVEPTPKAVRKAVRAIGEDIFIDFLKIKQADMMSQNPVFLTKRRSELEKVYKVYQTIKQSRQCLTLKDLAVNGDDLLALGIQKGRMLGVILEKLLDIVIANPEKNQKEILLDIVKKHEWEVGSR